MSLKRCAKRIGRKLALSAGAGLVALALVLAALGFFATGFFLWISHLCGAPWAAAATGAALLLLAAISASFFFAQFRPRPDEPEAIPLELELAVGLSQILGSFIRRDPKWAMLAALTAGILSEFLGGDKKRD